MPLAFHSIPESHTGSKLRIIIYRGLAPCKNLLDQSCVDYLNTGRLATGWLDPSELVFLEIGCLICAAMLQCCLVAVHCTAKGMESCDAEPRWSSLASTGSEYCDDRVGEAVLACLREGDSVG